MSNQSWDPFTRHYGRNPFGPSMSPQEYLDLQNVRRKRKEVLDAFIRKWGEKTKHLQKFLEDWQHEKIKISQNVDKQTRYNLIISYQNKHLSINDLKTFITDCDQLLAYDFTEERQDKQIAIVLDGMSAAKNKLLIILQEMIQLAK